MGRVLKEWLLLTLRCRIFNKNGAAEDLCSGNKYEESNKMVTNGLFVGVANGLSPVGSYLIRGGLGHRIVSNGADTASLKPNTKLIELVGPSLSVIGFSSSSGGLEHGLDVIGAGNANILNKKHLGSSGGVTNGLNDWKGDVWIVMMGLLFIQVQSMI
ncbi:hypothetical protein ACOSQ4_022712 [Xanthoceras sorbifolium]